MHRDHFMLETLQHSAVATAIANSLLLTASLSALHVAGFALVSGGALVSNLRLLGVLFPDRPVAEIVGPTRRGMAAGLLVSVVTGALLFSTRATAASQNEFFQVKMTLLVGALLMQFIVQRRLVDLRPDAATFKGAGALGLMLWLGVGLAGCAFILLE